MQKFHFTILHLDIIHL